MPIVFDEDCPTMTSEQLKQFKRLNKKRQPCESFPKRCRNILLEEIRSGLKEKK